MKKTELNTGWKVAVVPSLALKSEVDPDSFTEQAFLPATVPGCVELDLFANKQLKDPYYAQNPYDYRFLEGKDYLYVTEFEADTDFDTIHFSGIDTIADIFLNGEHIGHTENMFLEYDFPVCIKPGKNMLAVYIFSPVVAVRKYDIPAFCNAQKFNFETLYIRKIASMYGWDIMPRFVSGGIFGPVTVYKKKKPALQNVGLFTLGISEKNNSAILRLSWSFDTEDALLDGYQIQMEGICGERFFQATEHVMFTAGILNCRIEDPLLWYPRHYGDQPLYRIKREHGWS